MSEWKPLKTVPTGLGFIPGLWILGLLVLGLPLTAVADADLGKARGFQEKGEYRAAVIELKNLLQKDPGDAEARLLLGKIYLDTGDGASAEKELERAARLDVDPGRWKLDLARAYLLQGKYQEALERLPLAQEGVSAVERTRVLTLRGEAYLGLRDQEQAAREFEQALRLDAGNSAAAVGQIRVALLSGDRDTASRLTDELLARTPDNLEALLIRAELDRQAGRLKAAVAGFSRVLELRPDQIRARLGRATVLIGLRDAAAATADLDAADKSRPGIPVTAYLRGLIAFQQKDFDKAGRYFQEVLKVAPNHLQSQFLYGVISYSKGNLQIAEEYLSNAARQMSDKPQVVKLLAATRMKLKDPKGAIEVLEPLAEKTGDPQMLAMLGSAYMMQGDQARGAELLQRAVDKQPDMAAYRTQLALGLLAGGEAEQAIDQLKTAVDLGQDVLQADVMLVLTRIKEKQFDAAIEAGLALQKRMPDSPIPYNLTGLAYLSKGDKADAIGSFNKALEVDANFTTAAVNLARIDIADGNLEAAAQRYRKILEQDARNLNAMLGLAALAEKQGDRKQLVAWLEKARQANPKSLRPGMMLTAFYLNTGRPLKALADANELASEFPNNVGVIELLGSAQMAAGEYSNAVHSLRRLTELRPENPQALFLLGRAQKRAGDLDGARGSLHQALELNPELLKARLALASLELQAGNRERALEIAGELQTSRPELAAGYALEGHVQLAMKRADAAVPAYRQAYERKPTSLVARRLAQALLTTGKPDASVAILRDWLGKQPKDLSARLQLAMTLQNLGREDDSIREYEAIYEVRKDNVVLLNNLAWLYLQKQDPRAMEVGKRAYELAPKKPEVVDTYGWILLHQGDPNEALVILQQAYVSFPTNPDIGYHVAVAMDKANRKKEAVRILKRIVKETPDFADADAARALLTKLGG